MAYDQTNRGALFRNDDKQSETHPDYKGKLNVDGVEFFLDAWLKTAASGVKFMSVSVKRKNKQPEPVPEREMPPAKPAAKSTHGESRRQAVRNVMDDDLPF